MMYDDHREAGGDNSSLARAEFAAKLVRERPVHAPLSREST
jgi:hypothetical protein